MKRTTIVDVGRLAGVSAKTVSRVLNDEPHVSAAVKQRVREAADQLDYHPNVFAQALVRRKSNMIGLIYENPSPSYVVELQRGVLERLKGERYRLVVIPIRSVQEHAAEVVGILRSAALDGVVLAPPASDNPIILNQLRDARILCARIVPTRMIEAAPSNLVDDVAAARAIAEYVIELGHREIAIIRGDPTHASTEARMLGYMQALHTAGIDMRLERIEPGLFTFDSGLVAGRQIFGRGDRPTAILAQNDDMAVGAMMAAREFGLSIPDDVSIVGFDDSEVSRVTWPRLTTIRQPVFEMAVAATEMLVAQLEGQEFAMRIMHPHELMIRESAAPPRP
ncbi:LacI family DNA-binding transcriptional regulator [Sphingomonas sp. BAUL-RG-20F-R05-02]|uniref:LacI family DNA-binding transcriptional regulator n=1 Tax=Sphingomonas sp. BAUL-RG-20F-R05-02 TaxID=2914830 RepID=UPI001F5A4056|nr:LacI family DNA-binding transcriptional regulator [Sphingomonas sp. BAUL-RG-20F-R05-02]